MIFDRQPNYIILGGLVLQELSLPFLLDYGKTWQLSAPVHLVYYEKHQHDLVAENREKIVLLSGVLPNPFTIGYEDLSNLVVRRINDRNIGKLSDVPMALVHPVKGFHKIEFEQAPGVIYLDPREIPSIDRLIQERYNIPVLNHLAD
jgi:hypothetical protein